MNWIEAKSLQQLYLNGKVRKNKTIAESAEIRFLLNSLDKVFESHDMLYASDNYNTYYEATYLADFVEYDSFLKQLGLAKPQMRFELQDIAILMRMYKGRMDGTLEYLRDQVVSANESLKGVSLMFFRHEKYLLSRPGLVDAVKKMLDVKDFANEKDKQYVYRLECHNPRVIVLCENLDFLTKPNKPRQYNIELWYAGGKNIRKLEYSNPRGLPIYYSCDWDYDGLLIYSWVKEIIPSIKLLYPNGTPKSIEDTDHGSLWHNSVSKEFLSGLPATIFTEGQRELINNLISANAWIIEESNDILTMLKKDNFLNS